MKRAPLRPVVLNGTQRPLGLWNIAGVGPCEWILSHRWFFRMMGCEEFRSIYTPKPALTARKRIPSLDGRWTRDEVPF